MHTYDLIPPRPVGESTLSAVCEQRGTCSRYASILTAALYSEFWFVLFCFADAGAESEYACQ